MPRFNHVLKYLMKRIITCLTVLFLWLFPIEAQMFSPYMEAGVFGGVCYYLGDINPRKQLYNPGLSLGELMKYNFTEHHSVRGGIVFGQLKGDDRDFKNEYQQKRVQGFETSLVEFHVGYEFNFLPYVINRYVKSHTPYIFAGIGYSLIISSTTWTETEPDIVPAKNHAAIPFGVGYKYRISESVSLGCEWGMRKTFTDNLDGILNPGPDGSYAKTHNNDWYSFVGVYATFRIFEKRFSCPGVLPEQKKYR